MYVSKVDVIYIYIYLRYTISIHIKLFFFPNMADFETLTKVLYQDVSIIYREKIYTSNKGTNLFERKDAQDGPGKQLDFERKDAGALRGQLRSCSCGWRYLGSTPSVAAN